MCGRGGERLKRLAALYGQMTDVLVRELPDSVVQSTQNGFPVTAWTRDERLALADALTQVRDREEEAIAIIRELLEHL